MVLPQMAAPVGADVPSLMGGEEHPCDGRAPPLEPMACLEVQVADLSGVGDDEVASAFHVVSHQHRNRLIC